MKNDQTTLEDLREIEELKKNLDHYVSQMKAKAEEMEKLNQQANNVRSLIKAIIQKYEP